MRIACASGTGRGVHFHGNDATARPKSNSRGPVSLFLLFHILYIASISTLRLFPRIRRIIFDMKILIFTPLLLVGLVAVDEAALGGRYSAAVMAQSDSWGGEVSRDVRHWISRTLGGR